MDKTRTVSHDEIIAETGRRVGIKKAQLNAILNDYICVITTHITNGNSVNIRDIGTLKIKTTLDTPPQKRVKLQACVALKSAVTKR